MSCPVLRFSPHPSGACHPSVLIVFGTGVVYGIILLVNGRPDRPAIALLSALIILPLLAVLCLLHRYRHTVCEIRRDTVSVTSPRGERILKRGSLDRVEVCSGVLSGIPRIRRVRIYSHAAGKAWLSVWLSGKDSDALIRALVPPGRETGRTVSARYSSAAYALVSENTVLPFLFSLEFTVLAGDSLVMMTAAGGMLALSLLNMLAALVSSGGMSLTRWEDGGCVITGFRGFRRAYIPGSSVVGVTVRRSPGELLCGTGSVYLMTESGRKIPCMRMLPARDILPAVCGMLGVGEKNAVCFSGEKAASKEYAVGFAASFFASFLTAFFSWSAKGASLRLVLCLASAGFVFVAVRNLAGVFCSSGTGLKVSASCWFSAGTAGCSCVYLCLKRQKVAGIRINSPLLGRTDDLCSAGLLTGSGRSCVWNRCVPYGAIQGFAGRFC